jgi:lysophospholipase L1-like esterase
MVAVSDGTRRGRVARRVSALVLGALASLVACGSACGSSQRGDGPAIAAPGDDGERARSSATAATTATSERPAAGPGEAGATTGAGEPAPPRPPAPLPPFLEAPPGSLDALYAGLLEATHAAAISGPPAGAARGEGRVLISIFGDSHTAGDRMTARLRQVLGERFGDAGRGLVAVGKPPIRHYYQTELRYGSMGKWKATIGGHRDGEEPFGMAGLRIFTRDRRAQGWVETCGDCALPGRSGRVSRFELFYWAHPGGAKLRYRVDREKWQTLPTAPKGGGPRPARAVIAVPDGPHRLTIEPAGSGTVSLFGVALERARPGVIIDGLGVVGRTVLQLAAWDWSVISAQLADRSPRLVILQYGTNEADHDDLDLAALARRYDQVIARVRAAVPGAAILLLGPPDMAVRQDGKACDDPKRGVPPFRAPVPLAPEPPQTPILDPVTGVAVDPSVTFIDHACQWRTPPRLLGVVAAQREAARRNRVAFFDTLSALGGAETIDALAVAVPPLAAKDRVHLTQLGYVRWADALLAELLAGYDAYAAAAAAEPGASSSPAAPSAPTSSPPPEK